MNYKDVADDVEALWYAALWCQNPVYGLLMMDIVVERYVLGHPGPMYYAVTWEHYVGVVLFGGRERLVVHRSS